MRADAQRGDGGGAGGAGVAFRLVGELPGDGAAGVGRVRGGDDEVDENGLRLREVGGRAGRFVRRDQGLHGVRVVVVVDVLVSREVLPCAEGVPCRVPVVLQGGYGGVDLGWGEAVGGGMEHDRYAGWVSCRME